MSSQSLELFAEATEQRAEAARLRRKGRNMKRIIVGLVVAAFLAIGLTACEGGTAPPPGQPGGPPVARVAH